MPSDSDEVQELFDRIASCMSRAVKLDASVFRSVGVRYANERDLLTGDGASYYGGRWNRPGIKAIYASLDPVTAVKESYQELLRYGFSTANIRPRVMVGVKVQVNRLLNLTNAGTRRRLGFTLAELIGEDWQAIQNYGDESWTQAIGRGSLMANFEGLLVPSVHDRHGTNVVLFPSELLPTSKLVVIAGDELPPHPS